MMNMDDSMFITYNPKSELEQALAVRLYTIAAVNGLNVYLPERLGGRQLTQETIGRIRLSKWFVC